MANPVPKELLLAGPALTWDWDPNDPTLGQAKIREYLDSYRAHNARVVLMAKGEEFEKIGMSGKEWDKEPWYGTEYRVDRFDEEFLREVRHVLFGKRSISLWVASVCSG